jgi:adenine specific DNA methylase Mod
VSVRGFAGKSRKVHHLAYDDKFDRDLAYYIENMTVRLLMMRDLLADDGLMWVHLDWHSAHYIKLVLDELMGEKNFVNEIIWCYKSGGSGKRHFARKHDTILVYSKTENYRINVPGEKSYNRDYKPYRFKGVKEYQDGNLLLISNDTFRATFSALSANFHAPHLKNGGASMNLLYHKKYGIVCAATTAGYDPTEPLNQQYLRKKTNPPCMTAQMIVDDEYCCFDKDPVLSYKGTEITAKGEKWSVVYEFTDEYKEKNESLIELYKEEYHGVAYSKNLLNHMLGLDDALMAEEKPIKQMYLVFKFDNPYWKTYRKDILEPIVRNYNDEDEAARQSGRAEYIRIFEKKLKDISSIAEAVEGIFNKK